MRAGAAPVRQRVPTRLPLFRNWLGNPKFRVHQLLEFVFDHVSQYDDPFSSFFIQLLFSNLKKKSTPELYLTRAGYQFED